MTIVPSTEAKNRFGALVDQARHEPVMISKQGRSVAVMLSMERFLELQSLEERCAPELSRQHEKARETALRALRNPRPLGGKGVNRDELYEERVGQWI